MKIQTLKLLTDICMLSIIVSTILLYFMVSGCQLLVAYVEATIILDLHFLCITYGLASMIVEEALHMYKDSVYN